MMIAEAEQNLDIDCQYLVAEQRAYFNSNATRALAFRLEQLTKLKELINTYEDDLHRAIYDDFGKSKFENQLTEIFPLIHEIDLALKNLDRWMRPKPVSTNLVNFPAKSYLVPEPLGVSLVIGAWNFPYNLSLTPVVGSMAAGNTTILKPSELPANTSRIMAKLINEHFDPRYLKVVEGGIPETTALLEQRYDKIFFTGSPAVGKIVNKAAAPHLTNVTLELGGKNPAIFSEDCALDVSIKRMIWGKFTNAGQFCIAPDYVLVQKSIKDAFLEQAVAEIEKRNYSVEQGNFVRIINEKNFDRVVALIDTEKVYYGGSYDREERVIEPTLMHNVSLDDAVMQDEIFGPLLPVIAYETIDDAFAIIKQFEKPLSAYLFTDNRETVNRFLTEIPFGNGGINEATMQVANSNLPFGGVGSSGMGRYHGEYSFECFSHLKGVIDKPTFLETDLKHYGYSEKKMSVIKRLL